MTVMVTTVMMIIYGILTGLNLSLMKNTFQGDFVLCVKEGKKVSHYIINREDQGYRIGNSDFCSFSSRVR